MSKNAITTTRRPSDSSQPIRSHAQTPVPILVPKAQTSVVSTGGDHGESFCLRRPWTYQSRRRTRTRSGLMSTTPLQCQTPDLRMQLGGRLSLSRDPLHGRNAFQPSWYLRVSDTRFERPCALTLSARDRNRLFSQSDWQPARGMAKHFARSRPL
jgi:hypothetical protein